MKKLPLILALLATSTVATADQEGYIKAFAGAAKFKAIKSDHDTTNFGAASSKYKQSICSPIYGIAAGTKFNSFRAEMSALMLTPAKMKASATSVGNGSRTLVRKPRMLSVFFTGYYDLPQVTSFTPYVGAGLGATQIKEKYSSLLQNGDVKNHNVKSVTSLSYKAVVGVNFDVTSNISVDLEYNYIYFGKGRKAEQNNYNYGNKKYSAHLATVGFRFGF